MGWKNPIRALGLMSSSGAGKPADEAVSNKPTPSEPLPLVRSVGSVLGPLGRRKPSDPDTMTPTPIQVFRRGVANALRPTNIKISHPFGSRTRVKATPASPGFKFDDDDLLERKAGDGEKTIERQRTRIAKASVGHLDVIKVDRKNVDKRAPSCRKVLSERAEAKLHIIRSFAPQSAQQQQKAEDFADEILNTFAYDGKARSPYKKAIITTRALVVVSGRDMELARDAFRALARTADNPDEQAERRAFGLQCELARTPNGFDALLEAAPYTMSKLPELEDKEPEFTKTEQRIHRDAHVATLSAARILLAAWPEGLPAPRNLKELYEIANWALPGEERDAGPWKDLAALESVRYMLPSELARFPWFKPEIDEPVKEALLSHPFALRALVTGSALMRDPRAGPCSALREAYFAFRHEISEQELPKFKSRFFRLVTQAERYTRDAETQSWLKRAANTVIHRTSETDTPFKALRKGTGGIFLDHPDKDFSLLHAIDVVIDKLNEVIDREPPRKRGERPHPAIMQAAIDAAVAHRWEQKIMETGWHDDMRLRSYEHERIKRHVATRLNLDRAYIDRNKLDHLIPKVVNAFNLEAMAIRSGADMDQIITRTNPSHATVGKAPRTLRECIERAILTHGKAHHPPENAQGNFDVIVDILKRIADTWTLRLLSGKLSGLAGGMPSANPHAKSSNRATAVIPQLVLTGERSNVLEFGSTAQCGIVGIGTSKTRRIIAGVGGYLGSYHGAVVKSVDGGISIGTESAVEDGLVFRSRREDLDDPTNQDAWRAPLIDVVETGATSGPNGALPKTPDQMWNAVSNKFFKDPNLSVNWVESKRKTRFVDGFAELALRLSGWKGYKTGVFGTIDARWSRTERQLKDMTGAQKMDNYASGNSHGVTVAATAVFSWESFGIPKVGPFDSTTPPSVPLLSASATVLGASAESVLRLFSDGGVVDPKRSFLDTDFTSPWRFLAYIYNNYVEWYKGFGDEHKFNQLAKTIGGSMIEDIVRHIDKNGKRWRKALGSKAAVAEFRQELPSFTIADIDAHIQKHPDVWRKALGGQRKLDTFLTNAVLSTTQGNRHWGERRQLTEEGADDFNDLSDVIVSHDDSIEPLTPDEQMFVASSLEEVTSILKDKANFAPLLLYGYEVNEETTTHGPNWPAVAVSVETRSAEREVHFERKKTHV